MMEAETRQGQALRGPVATDQSLALGPDHTGATGAAQSEETVPETGLAAKLAASPGVPVPPKVEPFAGMTQNSL